MTQIHEHALGLTWVMDDAMQRAAHALVADDGRVWLVDPVDDPAAMERVAALGEPAGVLQLLDRHNRDCTALAQRLGVPHFSVPDALPNGPFTPERVVRNRFWNEVALWWPQRRALIVAEALGTAPAFAVGAGPVGVHPMLRLRPPHQLKAFDAEHLLVGHGPPVHGPHTAEAIAEAIDHAWRDTPRLLLKLPSLVLAGR
ncbi:MAG TPA: hypothetical protein VK501_02460 [Baekduia sp.]|uniref:hypothetical protein n=1 Tax=Baekduia sp. TaxID=2600305 RepID=UPI002C67DCFB|nr:hypothetical protein [Baekduia sp.]HMJ32753.1 hypothetical protein [Baekduia sp.]